MVVKPGHGGTDEPRLPPIRRPRSWVGYWLVVAVLIGFGMVAIFSIGAPFLLLGLTLAIFGPWRDRPTVVWTAVAAVVGFVIGVLVALPWSCGKSVGPFDPETGHRVIRSMGSCSTAIGLFHYDSASPSYVPGLLVAGVLAVVAAVAVHRSVIRRLASEAERSRAQLRAG
jgi:hypothetical protein